MALTLAQVLLRRGVPRAWVTVAGYEAAAIALPVLALAPSVPALYVGAVFAALPLMSLTPVRTAAAREFHADGLDGTFTGRTRAWSYVIRAVLAIAIAFTAFFLPHGWRVATLGLAVWVGAVGIMLARADLPDPTPAAERTSLWQLWDLARAAELRSAQLALFCSNFILQLALLNVEPFLAEAGLGRWATVAVSLLSIVPLATLPLTTRLGHLSNDRVWRSAGLAAMLMAASGVFAVGMLAQLPLIALVAVAVAARGVGEAGAGPLNDAVRTYASRQAPEADALGTVLTVAAYYAGAQLPLLVGWPASVVAWLGASLLAVVLTHRHHRRPIWDLDVERPRVPEIRIALGSVSGTDARVRLWLNLGGIESFTYAKEGDLLVVSTPLDPDDPDSARITVFEVLLRARWRPREPRRAYGRLFPGARFACLAEDGRRFGVGRWKGKPGEWQIVGNLGTSLRSPDAERPLRAVLMVHNA